MDELPPLESSHLPNKGRQSSNQSSTGAGSSTPNFSNFQVSYSMVVDGTMAVEVQLAHALLQWPYLTDMTMVSAIVSVFVPSWGGPAWTLEQVLQLRRQSWLYFNLLIRDSQVGPVLHVQLLIKTHCLVDLRLKRQLGDTALDGIMQSEGGVM